MKSITCLSLAVLFVGGLIGASGVTANQLRSQCVRDANDAFRDCRAYCQEEMQAAKDECRNIPHECAEACRTVRDACVDDAMDELDACLAPCNTDLLTNKELCRRLTDLAARDHCIDGAQIAAFVCRDECRESARVAVALKQCGKAFRICLKGCLN